MPPASAEQNPSNVAMSAFNPALKEALKRALVAQLKPTKPAIITSFRLTPAALVSPSARISAVNLVEARPEVFAFALFRNTPSDSRLREEERGAVEMRLSGLASGMSYLVDCTLGFRSSRSNRLNGAMPMPTFTIGRNGVAASETPSGSSLNATTFHFVTGFSAIDGENLLRFQAQAAQGVLDWRAEWYGCDVEALR